MQPKVGKRVLVIGGGSVAVDVALTAQRLGATEVTMACLESQETMPAILEDVEQALEEGITILPSWVPPCPGTGWEAHGHGAGALHRGLRQSRTFRAGI